MSDPIPGELSRRGLLFGLLAIGCGSGAAVRAEEPRPFQVTVDGVERQALVFTPTKKSDSPLPLVLAFHGHGGGARQASNSFRLHEQWPEALVVYMQGLLTPGKLTDPEGKEAGWQHAVGQEGDRDLKFVDAALAALKKEYSVDARRIYATGHSNGGAFTYALWAARPDLFAAFAPSAVGSRAVLTLKPKPAMHIAGENDRVVKFPAQKRSMQVVRRVNGCESTGTEWAKYCTLYPSAKNTPFIEYIHPGTHRFPPEASALIVRFFKEHALGEAR